jgi:17beta-estradiol 17-dehydrogenase / very-long-chain 3-oxoacyl-CoA reductase
MLSFILNILVSLVVLKLIMRLCQFFTSIFWYRDYQNYASKYGINSWALITDAAGDLGYEFAEGLTTRGLNVILIGRNLAELQAKEKDLLKANSEIQTKIIEFDFAKDTSISDYQTKIYDHISNLEVSILVNNAGLAVAGMGTPCNDASGEGVSGEGWVISALNTNILAQTNLLHHFIPIFNKRARRSAVIDVSGFLVGSVYQPVYGATKAFNYTLTVAES